MSLPLPSALPGALAVAAVAVSASLAVVGVSALSAAATRSSVSEPTTLPAVCADPAPGRAPQLPDAGASAGLPGDLPADAGALAARLRRDPAAAAAARDVVGPGTPAEQAARLRALAGEGGAGSGGAGGGSTGGTGTGGSGTVGTGGSTGGSPGSSSGGSTGGSGGSTGGSGGSTGGSGGSTGGSGSSTGGSGGSTGGTGTATGGAGTGGSGTTEAAPQTGTDPRSDVLSVPTAAPSPPPPPPPQAAPEQEQPGPRWLLLALAALALVVLLALAAALVRRRSGTDDGSAPKPTLEVAERQLALAERREDHEAALRWVFVTGLLRLDAAGVLAWDPSRTSADVARQLRKARFDELRTVFDEVVYGRRPATADDVARQRRGWDELVPAGPA